MLQIKFVAIVVSQWPMTKVQQRGKDRIHTVVGSIHNPNWNHVHPLLYYLYTCDDRPSSASTSTGNPKRGAAGAEKEKEVSQEYLILLADPHLMRLPLEALNVLQTENLTSVTRDVSLQMFFHKVHQQVLGWSIQVIGLSIEILHLMIRLKLKS